MPERSKKEHKHVRRSGQTGSRWHNFHFSGKLISCSVIFGFLLILVGGILLAIGMDSDEETKSNDYKDLQKKPPLIYVGPVIMGIGGFTVIVGIIMCLVETKVFRRRGEDANNLINSEGGESSRSNEAINGASGPTGIPSNSKHHKHRNCSKARKAGDGKRSPHSPRSHTSQESSSCSSQASEPIGISGKGSRNFLSASDTFMTPPGSFNQDDFLMQGAKRNDVSQTTASLLKSYSSSGTYSTEFQTPSASFIDTPSFPNFQESPEVPTPQPLLNLPANLSEKSLENKRHQFLTPQNSNADVLEPPKKPKEEYSPVVNRHAFLTPKNSIDLLEDSPINKETLEQPMGNSSNHPDKVTTMSIVADVHKPSKQQSSDTNEASAESSAIHSKPQEVEHSDIKVDVLIDAIDDEIKGTTHASTSNATDEEVSNPIEESDLSAHSHEHTSGDNFNTDDLTSNEGLDSAIVDNADSLQSPE